tara:strand:- start:1785 stop:2282 length:498 start_codon:yes stop_codon:yes gene_type:complete
MVSKKVKFPASLGRFKKNKLKEQGGVITQGMWVNLNAENYGSPPRWKKTTAIGSIVDRSIGYQQWGNDYGEMAIFCHYPNPELEMMMFSLESVDSPLFDMDTQPTQSRERRLLSQINPPIDYSLFPQVTPEVAPTNDKMAPLIFTSTLATILLWLPVVGGARANP